MCWRGLTAIALLCFPVACGGRVLEESTPDGTSTPKQTDTSPDASAPATKPSSGTSSKNPNGMVTLPECVPGKLASKVDPASLATACPYLYAGRCYVKKVNACACACPNKAGTVCSSGFPSLDGTTSVSCS